MYVPAAVCIISNAELQSMRTMAHCRLQGGFRADFLASSYRVILTSGLIGTIAVEQFGTIPSDGTTLNRLDSIRWAGNEPKP
uniref:ABC transporter permease n=1 Tax=Ascaris lumbricoides TaxID=6252 RepID=A0A0M3HT33_ASCLU